MKKICETCGKDITEFDLYKPNNFAQCQECAIKCAIEGKTQPDIPNASRYNKIIDYSSNFWIKTIKVFVIIGFVLSVIGSIAGAVYAVHFDYHNESVAVIVIGLIAFLVISFIITGLLMVFLNLAEDVSVIKNFYRQECIDNKQK